MSEHAPVVGPAEDGTMSPSVGLSVIHLFAKPTLVYEADEFIAAVKDAEAAGGGRCTVVCGVCGHCSAGRPIRAVGLQGS